MTDEASIRTAFAPRYEIEGEVGRGGMATVYRALDHQLGRVIALKVLHPELTHLLGADRFHREVSIAAGLQHANIVSLYEAGEAGGFLYFTMPLVVGETLRTRLEREAQLPVDEAVRIAEQIAEALDAAHSSGVVHRDVKPENILLSGDRALVADFGIARAITAAGENKLTSAGIVVGTPEYMSPEQAGGSTALDGRSDIYALGCVLYEMLVGEPPCTGPTAQAVVARQLQEAPRSVRVVRPTVTAELEAVVDRALAKVPADRFPTARSFSAALERARREPSDVAALGRGLWRHRRLLGAAGVALVGVALAARFVLGRSAFAAGVRAFDRWDIRHAQQQLRRAVQADPRNGEAYLWLAQAAVLQGADTSEWRPSASSALAFARHLPNLRDSTLARALNALAVGSYPQACAAYDSLRARDTLDVLAWFGLGECRRRDETVVRDTRSPTGWRFRSSYQGAVSAYQHALQILPQFNFAFGPAAYNRLVGTLVPEPIWARPGVALAPDTGLFLAYPALDHDTLILLPHRASDFGIDPPPSHAAAIAKGRKLYRELATDWVRAFPRSDRAHAARARALELGGELTDSGGRPSALAEIREARRLASDPVLALGDAMTELRLLLKLEQFGRVRVLADSLLAVNPRPVDESSAWQLACAAALVGQAHRTADLLAGTASDSSFESPVERPQEVPLQATRAALRLMAYASLGAPAESLPALEGQVDTALRRYVEPDRVETVRRQILALSDLLAFPVRGRMRAADSAAMAFLSEIAWPLARGDTAAARTRLAQVRRDQARMGPTSLLPEHVYLQSWLSATVHDTAAAEALLGLSLDNLAASPTMLIGEPMMAGTLVRAMALEAALARRRHDPSRARKWTARVDTLWSGSDLPQLRSLVDSLAGPERATLGERVMVAPLRRSR